MIRVLKEKQVLAELQEQEKKKKDLVYLQPQLQPVEIQSTSGSWWDSFFRKYTSLKTGEQDLKSDEGKSSTCV